MSYLMLCIFHFVLIKQLIQIYLLTFFLLLVCVANTIFWMSV